MASRDYYVDNVSGSDNNGGTSEGSAIVSGTAGSTNSTATVTLDGGSDLSGVVVGDTIRISGEIGGIRSGDIFEITAVNDGADTVDVTPTPGTASGLIWAIGGAWATLNKLMDTLRAADTDKGWVKGGTDYTETMNIDIAAAPTTPFTLEGYTTTIGDGGQFTIDGGSVRSNGITSSSASSVYYVIKNAIIKNHTSNGITGSVDNITYKNCKFNNNGGTGANCDDFFKFEECEFLDNTANGCFTDVHSIMVGCKAYRNGAGGFRARTGVLYNCIVSSNAADAIIISGTGFDLHVVINCVVDGDAKDTNIGLSLAAATTGQVVVINTIVYDCVTGFTCQAGMGELLISRNNLFNNNTTDYTGGGATYKGEVTSAPDFVDEASLDYRLNDTSPAKAAGFDGSQVEGASSGMDIGARQRIEAGGAGGITKLVGVGGGLVG